jgi:hypothetical protein
MSVRNHVATNQQIAAAEVHADWSEQNGGIYYGRTMGAQTVFRGYQQGQFYIISNNLTSCIIRHNLHQEREARGSGMHCDQTGPEDHYIGCLIHTATVESTACSAPIFIDMYKQKMVIEYRLNPLGKFSAQSSSFGDWDAFSASLTAVDQNAVKHVPGFDAKYDCMFPASLTEPMWQDEIEHGNDQNWHRLTMGELRKNIAASDTKLSADAIHFDPTIKGSGEGCGGDPYAKKEHKDDNWCKCRVGTVVWSALGQELKGKTNTWAKQSSDFAQIVAKFGGVLPISCKKENGHRYTVCSYHHNLVGDWVCKPPSSENPPSPAPAPAPAPALALAPAPAPAPAAMFTLPVRTIQKAKEADSGDCSERYMIHKRAETHATAKVKALEQILNHLKKTLEE